MKGKFSSMWRVVIALALVLSISLVAAPALVQADPGSTGITFGSADDGTAAWNSTAATVKHGSYSVKLAELATGDAGSTHLQFIPASGITVSDFQEAITDVTPDWSFWHYLSADTANWVQFELRFEDPDSTGWLEITAVPQQNTLGTAAWLETTLAKATTAGFGGNTPDGTSVFDWSPLTALSVILADVNTAWDSAETGKTVNAYELERVRLELWEISPARTCYVDDVTIDGTLYEIEPLKFVNASDTEISTAPSTGSFYLYVACVDWNTSEFTADTGQVTLEVTDGVGTTVSTNAYTMTESGKDTSHFRTGAISGSDLNLKPGYKLEASIATTSFGSGSTAASVVGTTPGYARAEISFDKTYYDVGEDMTITVKDDSANGDATTAENLDTVLSSANDGSEVVIDIDGTHEKIIALANFVETGVDTGEFAYTTKPTTVGLVTFATGDTMEIHFQNGDILTTAGTAVDEWDASGAGAGAAGADGVYEVKATAGVLLQSNSSVAFGNGTYTTSATSAVVTVTDKDKNTSATTKQTISGSPVVVENVTTGDSITIASLVETAVNAGTFSATIYFGTGTGQLAINDGDQLKATYTDPSDSTDVSTGLAAVGYTVLLYNASDVLVNSYTTITAAEAAVVANDYTIVVKSSYASSDETWPVAVNTAFTGLTIKAEDSASVTIDPSLKTGHTNEDAFDVTSTYCTIEGLTFKNSYATATVTNLIDIVAAANHLTVKDCTFDLTAGYADDHGINNNSAVTNSVTVTGCSFNVGKSAYGIVDTQNEVKFTVEDSTFTGTDCTLPLKGWGIQITGIPPAVDDFLVESCTFDSLSRAIDINSNAGDITIRWSTIQNSTVATKGAINIHTSDPVVLIYGNSIKDNTGYSVYVESTSSPTNVDLVFNSITGNTKGVNNDVAGGTLNAKHNWWGTATGPTATDTTGDGTTTTTFYLTAPVELTAEYTEAAGGTFDKHLTVGIKAAAGGTGSAAANIVGLAQYTESPKAVLADASFYDAFVATYAGIDATSTVTVSFYTEGVTADSVAKFWNELSGTWDACSDQGFNSYEGYIWVLAKDQTATVPTSPTIQELTGSMFAICTAPAVTLESIAASPASVSLEVDETQQLTVTATYSDASTADVTAEASYESNDTSVATVSEAGLITGVAEGDATVTVTYLTETTTVSVTVGFDPMNYDADGDGVIDKTEALTAVADYFSGGMTKAQALLVIVEYMG